LDELTAGQIAAGEVVERPVSVVKELVENSLDAGADQIAIKITEGGKTGIMVSDNGCGMSQEEVSLAFCRHATSKITCAQDLSSLTTLGFRGEALPSIAAISHLVMKTKMSGDNVGQKIELKGGEILSLQPAGCPPGTTVFVTDLFYNTPARRKHLKSTGTEAGLVADMVQNMSLSRPEVRFSLQHNGRAVFRTPGSGRLVDAVFAVYGAAVAREMLEIKARQGNVKLKAYISKPSINRKTRSYITVIVNGRYVKNRFINQAIDEAYTGLIPSGRHPVVVLALDLSPELIDVNIHPAKMEIRIDNETEITEFIKGSIRERLKNTVLIPNYELRAGTKKSPHFLPSSRNQWGRGDAALRTGRSSFPAGNGQRLPPASNKNYYSQDSINYSPSKEQNVKGPTSLPAGVKEESRTESIPGSQEKPGHTFGDEGSKGKEKESTFPLLQVIGQLLPTYIMAGGPDGLYILDQHAAHERIIFEKLLVSLENGENRTQMLLTPVPLELNYRTQAILQENLANFTALGFILEDFGGEAYILRGVPAHLSTAAGVNQFVDILDELAALERQKDFNRALITRLACRAAIKSGEVLSFQAMEAIVQQLSCTTEPYTCPHGRPTLVKITEQELAQMFKRTN